MSTTITPTIHEFRGKYKFLSNFYPCPVTFEGFTYPSAEHAFQAAKSLDTQVRMQFSDPHMSPREAKHLGRKISLRPSWNKIKDTIMLHILQDKFTADSVLSRQLLATAPNILVEGNTWHDTYWGVCNGKGQNRLGKLLMYIRDEL